MLTFKKARQPAIFHESLDEICLEEFNLNSNCFWQIGTEQFHIQDMEQDFGGFTPILDSSWLFFYLWTISIAFLNKEERILVFKANNLRVGLCPKNKRSSSCANITLFPRLLKDLNVQFQ